MAGKPPDRAPASAGEIEFLRLLSGDSGYLQRLRAGESLRTVTPFTYPGRFGPLVLHLTPGDPQSDAGGTLKVRISDGGDLLKSLEEQGMDLAVDMILSKTVFHVVRQTEGAGIGSGHVFIDSDAGRLAADTWRFLQMLVEVIGLRHSKYKDALVRLSRRQDGPDLIDWPTR